MDKTLAYFLVMLFSLLFSGKTVAQHSAQMVRIAKLEIDSTYLESYKLALKEEIEASIKNEAGVLTLYAVSEKNKPTHFSILEIYADRNTYEKHLLTPHFLKYKNATKAMVKSLELVESNPLIPEMKIK